MSNFLSKFKKPNYKELYETELNNRKMYEKRYNEIKKENVELQKSSGVADLRKKLNEAMKKIAFLKEDRAKLYVQLEDTRNELNMLKNKQKSKRPYKKGAKKENGNKEILHK